MSRRTTLAVESLDSRAMPTPLTVTGTLLGAAAVLPLIEGTADTIVLTAPIAVDLEFLKTDPIR
jgi:hypothetical protein